MTTEVPQAPKVGDVITVRALRADGTCYRWWQATVEQVSSDCIVTLSPPGQLVHGLTSVAITQHAMRSFYWTDRMYNLIEEYAADGKWVELYVNVASTPSLVDGELVFTDHELDVSMEPGKPAIILDEDEFTEAALAYAYTPEFQERCHAACREALALVQTWKPGGLLSIR